MPGTVAYDPLFLIAHRDNSYHDLSISISVGLLLLVVGHYRSSMKQLLYQFSLVPGSRISMLLNELFYCSTYFPVEDIAYSLVLKRLWWVDVGYYLLLPFHWFLAIQVMLDTYVGWCYMYRAPLDTFLLIFMPLYLILVWLPFILLI